jgi:hypothetical protein
MSVVAKREKGSTVRESKGVIGAGRHLHHAERAQTTDHSQKGTQEVKK